MSTYEIQLTVIMDGVKPILLTQKFYLENEILAEWEPSFLYNYKNYGVDEIVQAIKVLKNAGYKHSYYFAPYEATPQVFYLHDNYWGGNMWGYPDLLMYAWYNYIMDIDLENEQFEWVKYHKEHKLNEGKNLSKVFVNNSYYLHKDTKYKLVSIDDLEYQIAQANKQGDGYQLDTKLKKHQELFKLVHSACYMSINFDIEKYKNTSIDGDTDFEAIYGNRLGNAVHMSLFRGLLSPKICENLSRKSVFELEPVLNTPIEAKYIHFSQYLCHKAMCIFLPEETKEETTEETEGVEARNGLKNGTSSQSSQLDVVQLIHSKVMSNKTHTSADDYINTFQFVCSWVKEYSRDSSEEMTYTEEKSKLKDKQIWPYLLVHLLKEIKIIDNQGLTSFGKFYESSAKWSHDQYLIIFMQMLKLGFPIDFTELGQSARDSLSLENNAINLCWSIISLLEIQIGEPWENFQLKADPFIKNFNYLADLIRDSINVYLESLLNSICLVDKLVEHKHYEPLYHTIKFKKSQGVYFASILKSVLQYNFRSDSKTGKVFSESNWPWADCISISNFVDILKEALTLWGWVYNMVADLTDKSRVEHINIAFSNADYVLKTKIKQLGLSERF